MTDLRKVGFEEVRGRLTGNRLAVYETLCRRGTATAIELAEAMGWDKTSVRPRLSELVDMFHARPTGVRRNHEHEFEAISVADAIKLHAQAKADAEQAERPADVSDPLQTQLPI